MSILSTAKLALQKEASAIEKLALSLDAELGKVFEQVISAILRIDGRVILTGMGKSGHIAKKIAATLASTGTPSFFIHPAEASHGDMGMLTSDDLVIALSKSGNTSELQDILHFCARYALPLVAITENADSPLAKHSNFLLQLPAEKEVCPLGAAPTTSTTLMLALGDALAVSLLEARGFTAQDFNTYHPGGSLGKKLLHVRDIMHKKDEIPLIEKDVLMSEALIVMTKYAFGCLGIIENNQLIGVITDGDLRRKMSDDFLSKSVSDIMGLSPITISSDTLVAAALQMMNSKKITALFIVDGNEPVGIVHIHDVLRAS